METSLPMPRPVRWSTRFAMIAALSTVSVTSGWGAGFFLPNQSTEATARGNAWVATADSSAAVYYNPAGLVQLGGPSVEGGIYAVHLGKEVDIGGVKYTPHEEWQAVPHFFYGQPINDKLTLGLGLFAPFGLGTEWGQATPFRLVTTEARLYYFRAAFAASYQVCDTVSVGATVGFDYAEGILKQGLGFFAGDELTFEGDDYAISWSIGILWKPHDRHSFGAVYRSATDMDLKGRVKSKPEGMGLPVGRAKLDLNTPASAAVGYAFKVTDKLTVEANIEWVNWDDFDSLTLRGSGVGAPSTIPFFWEDTFIYEIGFSYQINDTYTLHAGYDYNEGAQPDLFYNPGVGDADFQYLNVGVTRATENLELHVGYQYGWADYKVKNSVFPVNGKYSPENHAVMLSATWNF